MVFRGVSNGGKTATFTVAAETILQGQGKCLPSAFECKAIQLKAGQNETLQYLKAGTQTVQTFELRLVSITPGDGLRGRGREPLRRAVESRAGSAPPGEPGRDPRPRHELAGRRADPHPLTVSEPRPAGLRARVRREGCSDGQ